MSAVNAADADTLELDYVIKLTARWPSKKAKSGYQSETMRDRERSEVRKGPRQPKVRTAARRPKTFMDPELQKPRSCPSVDENETGNISCRIQQD